MIQNLDVIYVYCMVEMLYNGVHISSQFCIWWSPMGSLKLAMVVLFMHKLQNNGGNDVDLC